MSYRFLFLPFKYNLAEDVIIPYMLLPGHEPDTLFIVHEGDFRLTEQACRVSCFEQYSEDEYYLHNPYSAAIIRESVVTTYETHQILKTEEISDEGKSYLDLCVSLASAANEMGADDVIWGSWNSRVDFGDSVNNWMPAEIWNGSQQVMYSVEGARKLLSKFTEGHGPLKAEAHYDLQLKKELVRANPLNPESLFGCYVFKPIGGFADHNSGCDPQKGVFKCQWSSVHKQGGCVIRPGTTDRGRVLLYFSEQCREAFSTPFGLKENSIIVPSSRWHWKTLQPANGFCSRGDILKREKFQYKPIPRYKELQLTKVMMRNAVSSGTEGGTLRSLRCLRSAGLKKAMRLFVSHADEVSQIHLIFSFFALSLHHFNLYHLLLVFSLCLLYMFGPLQIYFQFNNLACGFSPVSFSLLFLYGL